MPNIAYMGCFQCKSPKPLPADLEELPRLIIMTFIVVDSLPQNDLLVHPKTNVSRGAAVLDIATLGGPDQGSLRSLEISP